MQRENYFIILGLDPKTSDIDLINKTILRKQSEWSKDRNNPSKTLAANQYLSLIQDMKAVMLNTSSRANEAREATLLLTAKKRQAINELSERLEILIVDGKISNSALKDLLSDVNKEFNVNISESEAMSDIKCDISYSDNENNTYMPIIDESVFNTTQLLLDSINKSDLFEFLGLNQSNSASDLLQQARLIINQSSNNSNKSTVQVQTDLATKCLAIFKNEESKISYINALAFYKFENKIGKFIDLAGKNDKEIDNLEYSKVIDFCKRANYSESEAKPLIKIFCDKRGYKILPINSSHVNKEKVTKQNSPINKKSSSGVMSLQIKVGILLFSVSFIFCIYFFLLAPFLRDKNADRYYTFANDAVIRTSKMTGITENIIEILPYGTELITYDHGSEWSQIKTNGKEGYTASKYILSKQDFFLLNSIFGDLDSKTIIATSKCRIALLNYFKEHNYIGKIDSDEQVKIFGSNLSNKEVWQVFAYPPNSNQNMVSFPKIVDPTSKFSDFAVIIKNITTNNRKLLLFTFSDDETPLLVYEQIAPNEGSIKEIKKIYTAGTVSYNVKYN